MKNTWIEDKESRSSIILAISVTTFYFAWGLWTAYLVYTGFSGDSTPGTGTVMSDILLLISGVGVISYIAGFGFAVVGDQREVRRHLMNWTPFLKISLLAIILKTGLFIAIAVIPVADTFLISQTDRNVVVDLMLVTAMFALLNRKAIQDSVNRYTVSTV